MGAHDPRSAQDRSTVHNLCSPALIHWTHDFNEEALSLKDNNSVQLGGLDFDLKVARIKEGVAPEKVNYRLEQLKSQESKKGRETY